MLEAKNVLKEFGMNENETQIYIILLKVGSATASEIAGKSGVHRINVYDILERLQEKGLISYVIKGKTKYFQAVEPEILKTIMREKEKKVEETIQQLKQLRNLSDKRQKVEIFEGIKSITTLMINLIENSKKGDEWLSFSVGEDELTEKGETFWDKVGIARYEKELNIKLLDNEIFKDRIREKYKERWKYISEIMRFGKTFF